MADETVQVVLELIDHASQPAQKIRKELSGLEKAGQSAKRGLDFSLKALGAIPAVAASATAAVIAFKKTVDFGEQGAQVEQMTRSWDFLMTKLELGPDVMRDLERAAGGTVRQFDIQASTMTLLAGAGDDLAREMAQNSAQLLEIARAASKLNPTLGDTQFLYDSLGRGIKRASPLILDNLGIVIKVGEAYEDYAASVGKTVNQLSAEERSMAILNATLESGQTLIEQAGGNVEALTDEYQRLKVNIQETTEQAQIFVHEGLEPILPVLNEFLDTGQKTSEALDVLGLSGFEGAQLMKEFGGTLEHQREQLHLFAERVLRVREELKGTKTDAHAAKEGIDEFGDELGAIPEEVEVKVSLNMLSDIETEIERLKTEAAGGVAIAAAVQRVVGPEGENLTEGERIKALELLQVGAIAVDFGAGLIGIEEAKESMVEDLGMTPEEADLVFKEFVIRGEFAAREVAAYIEKEIHAGAVAIAEDEAVQTMFDEPKHDAQAIREDIKALPSMKTVTIKIKVIGDKIPNLQHGGVLPQTGLAIVGEQGFEMVMSQHGRQVVIPHSVARQLLDLGIRPNQGFALDPGEGGGGTIPTKGGKKLPVKSGGGGGASKGGKTVSPKRPGTGGGGRGGGRVVVGGGIGVPGDGAGGGDGGSTAIAIQNAAAVVEQTIPEVVAAAIQPVVTQATQQSARQQAEIIRGNQEVAGLLTDILTVLISQGTADDTAAATAEAMQFADFA